MRSDATTANSFIQRHGTGKARNPNPHAFVAVPQSIVDDVGLHTHMGVRIDAAILSTFLFYAQRYQQAGDLRRPDGSRLEVQDGEFVLSVLKAAENLWARWFHLPSDNDQFDRFYRRVQKAMGRITTAKGLLTWRSWVNEDGKKTSGSVWSFEGTPLLPYIGIMPELMASEITVMRSAREDYQMAAPDGTPLINVADLVGSAFVSENIHMFTTAEACYSVWSRGMYMDYLGWTNGVAKTGAGGDRYVSVGATREEDRGNPNAPVFLYWFILDIDRENPLDAFEDVHSILYELDELGADISRIIVSYTGGKGFHVRIPSGMFDNPVFKSVREASRVISTLFADLVKGVELDSKVFDPRQLIRIIGSMRHTGGGDIYTSAFTGDEVLALTFEEVFQKSLEYRPAELPDPRTAEPVSEFVVALLSANDTTRVSRIPRYNRKNVPKGGGGGSVVRAALAGISEGDEWHPPRDGKSYIGRNYGMFIAACYHVKACDGDMDAAWDALKETNTKNDPPLSDSELRTCIASARRRVEKHDNLNTYSRW